jgi:hypothetical protein
LSSTIKNWCDGFTKYFDFDSHLFDPSVNPNVLISPTSKNKIILEGISTKLIDKVSLIIVLR